eukprot:TRINITY_DN16546_c0_g1_i1.p1 TRINITY_DN16546_c0_g1~~TRINITY_DN16546_c0_g1_i1.p1  ORF type:complete len:477 (-),score=53.42 TRINITY_DN16546_c0_g1_i1:60-1490(-)
MVIILSDDYLNENINYNTIKYLSIKSWQLGFARFALMWSWWIWVIVYKMLFMGQHLIEREIQGSLSVDAFPPRFGLATCNSYARNCDDLFQSVQDMPYCSESSFRPYADEHTRQCRFVASTDVLRDSGEDLFMIATHMSFFKLLDDCKPDRDNDFQCNGLWRMLDKTGFKQTTKDHPGKPLDDYFIADVERYTLHIGHHFYTSSESKEFKEVHINDMPGGWRSDQRAAGNTKDWYPSLCVRKQCAPGSLTLDMLNLTLRVEEPDGRDALQLQPPEKKAKYWHERDDFLKKKTLNANRYPMLSWNEVDVIPVGALLKMANVSLDPTPDDASSARLTGINLEVRIEYSNRRSWIGAKVWPWSHQQAEYTYSVRPLQDAKLDFDVKVTEESARAKKLKIIRGIRILFIQTGSILEWDLFTLLVVVSASSSLWMIMQLVLDSLLVYVGKHADKYMSLVYEMKEFDACPSKTRPSARVIRF